MKPKMFLRPLPEQLAALAWIQRHKAEILAERGGDPLNVDTIAILQQIREERDDYYKLNSGQQIDDW